LRDVLWRFLEKCVAYTNLASPLPVANRRQHRWQPWYARRWTKRTCLRPRKCFFQHQRTEVPQQRTKMPRSSLGYHLPPIRQECGVQVDKLDAGAPTMRFGPAILSGSRNPEPKKPDEPLDANNTERLLPSERSRDRLGPMPRNQEMKKRFHSNFPTSRTVS
jgi:hypothetical protein